MTPLLIVSHGQPSAPSPAEERLAAFASRVAALMPTPEVHSVTLATPGGLDRVVAQFRDVPFLVYPLFMSDGWFVSSQLPKRLAAAGGHPRILPPFGLDPGLPDLVRCALLDGTRVHGLNPLATSVVLTAHGSPRDPRPAAAAKAQSARLAGIFREVRLGFVDERPSIEDVARLDDPAITLPLFAATNGHVRDDVAGSLDAAGFTGPRLPPIGEHAEAPNLIAAAAMRAAGSVAEPL